MPAPTGPLDHESTPRPSGVASSYSRIADLPVRVEGFRFRTVERTVGDCQLRTVEVYLDGLGCLGAGEDVSLSRQAGPSRVLSAAAEEIVGEWSFHDFSHRLASTGIANSRRWALEAAGLELALVQSGLSLGQVLGREPRPVRWAMHPVQPGCSCLDQVAGWHRRSKGLHYVLDAEDDWSDELIAALADLGRVEVIDFHSYERDPMPPPELYQKIAYAFPDAVLEDVALTEETKALLQEHPGPKSWDMAIYSTIEIEALDPQMVNVRPPRFGWWRRMLDAYDLCEARGIPCYAGSSGELGVGLDQLRGLAALFHPEGPNQVAPPVTQLTGPGDPEELPANPLPPDSFSAAFDGTH